jgi:hypothetical protein
MGWRCGGGVLALALCAGMAPLTAQSAPTGEADRGSSRWARTALQAVERTDEIRIDGRLTEEAWARATPITEFVQSEPVEGGAPGARTEVRVLFDDQAIYVGARLYEDPSRIARQLVRRGETGQADYFEVLFDTNLDRRTGYRFRVSAAGVQSDAYLYNDGQADGSWDAVWASDVAVDSLGWTLELRIPWSQLRYEPGGGPQTWGINFVRWRVDAAERTFHALIPRNQQGRVSFFRPITGVRPPGNVRRVELRPYVLGRTHSGPTEEGDPFFQGREADARAGLDARYGLGTAFTLDATFNPDFGQVEVDPAVINLSAFETFFSERRPFFVEDARIFDFDLSGRRSQLFYSRRIGRAPQGGPPAGAVHSDLPDQTTILGAAKLTGRTSGGLSLGALAAVTGAAEGKAYLGSESGLADTLVVFAAEPRTQHGVLRARQDLRDGSTTVGGILTAIHRSLPEDGSLDFLSSQAYSGGIDFEHLWADRTWALTGFVAASHVRGDSTALIRIQRSPNHYRQRPESTRSLDPALTTLSGSNWRLGLARRGGRNWTGNVSVGHLGSGFEISDLGFSSAIEHIETTASVAYNRIEPGAVFREYRVRASTFQNFHPSLVDRPLDASTWSDTRRSGSVWVDANYTLRNFWQGFAEVAYRPAAYDGTATRGGPLLFSPPSRRMVARLNTDRRQPVSVGSVADYQWGDAFSIFEAGFDVRWRPAPRFELAVNPALTLRSSGDQYVTAFDDRAFEETHGRRYIFGDLERRTLSLETRMAVTFTRDLTLQLFAQPLLDAGEYTAYKQLAAPRTFDFHTLDPGEPVDYSGDGRIDGCRGGAICSHEGRQYVDVSGSGRADHSFLDRDFNVVSLRGNAVLRWEYRPGSTLFLVWQQQRFDRRPFGTFDPGRAPGDLAGIRPDNVFIIKLNYWFSP